MGIVRVWFPVAETDADLEKPIYESDETPLDDWATDGGMIVVSWLHTRCPMSTPAHPNCEGRNSQDRDIEPR